MSDFKAVQLKRSSVIGAVPTTEQLVDGELAINLADQKLYSKNGTIFQVVGATEDGTITTSKIVDNAITTDKINDSSVTTNKVIDNAINTDKLNNSSVTTSKIADDAVTSAKIAPTGVSAGEYGSATAIPVVTVNAEGQVTAATTQAVASSLRLISKTQVFGAGTSNGGTISVSLPTSLFNGNTPSFVMFSANARITGRTDLRYFYMCSGTDGTQQNMVLASSSDDTDQNGTGRADAASTFILPYSSSQSFYTALYGATLFINVIGYQV